jgi:hypothetical protein
VEEFGNLWTRTNLCGHPSEHGGQHNSARPARYWKFRTGTWLAGQIHIRNSVELRANF